MPVMRMVATPGFVVCSSMASASRWHADTYSAALGLIAAMLALGVIAFISLPAPE